MEGAAREGLISLFRRICENNQLTVGDVLSQLILLPMGVPREQLTKMTRGCYLLNRGRGVTRKLLEGIQALTIMGNLENLTLLELVDLKGVASLVVSKHRKWCGICFNDDLKTDSGPYDRLIWTINEVHACHIHKVKLRSKCQSCGAGPFQPLTSREISGRCPNCLGWLGGGAIQLNEPQDEYSRYLIWVATSFAGLLDSPIDIETNIAQKFRATLTALAEHHFKGKYAHLADAIKRNKSVIFTWLAGHSDTSWRALCEISFVFQVPLRDMLTGETDSILFSSVQSLPLAVIERLTNPRKLPQRRNVDEIREFMSKVQRGELPNVLTLNQVGARLSIDVRDLHRLAPNETARLSATLAKRRLAIRSRKKAARAQAMREEVFAIVLRLMMGTDRVTRRSVEKELNNKGHFVRRGEAPFVRDLVLLACAKYEAARHSGNK